MANLRKNSELLLKTNNLQIKMFQPNIRPFELPLISVIKVNIYFDSPQIWDLLKLICKFLKSWETDKLIRKLFHQVGKFM